jgi:hypothetical protein
MDFTIQTGSRRLITNRKACVFFPTLRKCHLEAISENVLLSYGLILRTPGLSSSLPLTCCRILKKANKNLSLRVKMLNFIFNSYIAYQSYILGDFFSCLMEKDL